MEGEAVGDRSGRGAAGAAKDPLPLTMSFLNLDDSREQGGALPGGGVGRGGAPRVAPVNPASSRYSAPGRTTARRTRAWPERCEALFEDLRRPARAMVARAYGRALSDDELDDVYSAAWTATLSALRSRGQAMGDDELRAYVLTAVASHASKELRRRSRKPAGSLEESHEQAVFDVHAPLPDERAIGSEAGGIARDLLASLPARRRAVMLLRYGWGLSPKEVCALVSGLSPRAYRKEVTRGVEQLIDRLKQVESGEWCESREPLLRDYVAGTASPEVGRQATQHLHHCRACSDLVARLSGHLHDLGSSVALAGAAGSIGPPKLPVADRILSFFDRGKQAASSVAERTESTATSVASSGGARGTGAAGAGVVAKIAGLGAAGKAAVLCIGAGAAATACVAAGVVPGLGLPGGPDGSERDHHARVQRERSIKPLAATPTPSPDSIIADVPPPDPGPDQGEATGSGDGGGSDGGAAEEPTPAPAPVETAPPPPPAPVNSTAPAAPPEDQEFGLPSSTAVAPAPSPAPSSSSSSAPSSGGTTEGSGASGSQIGQEFGP